MSNTDLVSFLTARLDEDEAAARGWFDRFPDMPADELADQAAAGVTDEGYIHIARHDPARVLREVAAKRKILAEHAQGWGHPCEAYTGPEFPCPTLRALAGVWSDHPDYDPAWQ
jgi:hypothetical protein